MKLKPMGGGGSFPSPAQLREPATPPLDMPSPPQTPALAPLEDSLFLWGGSGDGRDSAIPGTQTNKRARTAKGGMQGRGTSKARGALRKGHSTRGYLCHPLARRHLGTSVGSVGLQRDCAPAGGLGAPRPGDPTSGSPAHAPLHPRGLRAGRPCFPPPRQSLEGHGGEDPPRPRRGGLGSPEL